MCPSVLVSFWETRSGTQVAEKRSRHASESQSAEKGVFGARSPGTLLFRCVLLQCPFRLKALIRMLRKTVTDYLIDNQDIDKLLEQMSSRSRTAANS